MPFLSFLRVTPGGGHKNRYNEAASPLETHRKAVETSGESLRTDRVCPFFAALRPLHPGAAPAGSRSLPPGTSGEEVEVTVPPGTSASGFARLLREKGIVTEEADLLAWMVRMGIDRSLRAGIYRLHPGSPWEVAKEIRETRPRGFQRALIPGADWVDLTRGVSEDVWRDALSDPSLFPQPLRPLLPPKPEERLAFLLPDTYGVPEGSEGIPNLVRAASLAWWNRLGAAVQRGNWSRDTLLQRGILASLVEREVRSDEERPRVAAVFLNRLTRGMPLQSCATVVYAWKLRGEKRSTLSYRDLEIRSPFNTYRHRGLPPGPVGIPGLESWRAALEPAREEALFFFLGKDGKHVFSRTYQEHLRAQNALARKDAPSQGASRHTEPTAAMGQKSAPHLQEGDPNDP